MSYTPSKHTTSNKPYGVQGIPDAARTYYYDDLDTYKYRPFVDTAEVLAYFDTPAKRMGHFSIIINSGGTLDEGVITGGLNHEYWFKDGVADENLVIKYGEGVVASFELLSGSPNDNIALASIFATMNAATQAAQDDIDDHAARTDNPHSVTKAQVGLSDVDNTSDINKPVSTAQATAIAVVQADVNAHEARTDNPHNVTKAQVGLGNADDTSDINKPISTAMQTALDLKLSILTAASTYEPIFAKNTAFNKNFGSGAGTVAEGNDSRIINGQTAFTWGNHAGLYSLLGHTHVTDDITNLSSYTGFDARYYTQTQINNFFSGATLITGYNKDNWDAAHTYSQVGHIPLTQKGAANGVVPLDSGIKILETYLPDSVLGNLKYGGTYNGTVISASDDFPELDGQDLPTSGYTGVYFISTGTFTRSSVNYATGDWVLHNGSNNYVKVDNSDAVTTVFGRLGNVVANEADYESFYPKLSASYNNPSWINQLAWTKITGVPYAGASTDGILSSTDWNTFNNKQNAITPQALTKVDDTNVTLTLGGSPSTALLNATSITVGWTGTLADARIASATTWNAKQNALSGTGLVKSVGGTISYITDNSANWNTAYGWGNHTGLYLLLSGGTLTGNLHGTNSTFSGTVQGWGLLAEKPGSNTVGNGPYVQLGSSSNNRYWIDQMNATFHRDMWFYDSSTWSVKFNFSQGGTFTAKATASMGEWQAAGYAAFGHANHYSSATLYSLIQSSSGETIVNSGSQLYLRTVGVDRLTLTSTEARLSTNLYIPNNTALRGRNLANNADIWLIGANTANKVEIDSSGYGTTFGGGVTLNVNNAITSNGHSAIINSQYSGTNGNWINLQNAGGILYVGLENSASSSFGAAPYAGVIYRSAAYPIEFWTNALKRLSIMSNGKLYQTNSIAGDNNIQFENTSASGYGAYFRGGASTNYSFKVADYAGNDMLTLAPSTGLVLNSLVTIQTAAHGYLYIKGASSSYEAGIIFLDNNTAKWELYKNSSGHDFQLYNYNTSSVSMVIASYNNAVTLAGLSGSGDRFVITGSGGTLSTATIGSGLSFSGGVLSATGGSAGTVTGTGTAGYHAKWTSASNIGNSTMVSESGSTLTINAGANTNIQMTASSGNYTYLYMSAPSRSSYLFQNASGDTSNGCSAGAAYMYMTNSQNYELIWAGVVKSAWDSSGNQTISGTMTATNHVGNWNGYTYSTTATANTIALRDSNGYMRAVYFHADANRTSPTASGLTSMIGRLSGDGYYYDFTAGAVQTFLGLGNAAYQTYSDIASPSTIVRRDSNNYTYFSYINSNTSNGEGGTISQFITTNGSDGFYRKQSVAQVQTALGLGSNAYTSTAYYPNSNPSGFITGYTETDTLNSVTTRGATTSNAITVGSITATSGGFNSDIELKDILTRNITSFYVGNQVSAFLFNWNNDPRNNGRDKSIARIGYGAQEILKLFPNAVYQIEDGSYAVDYTQVHTLLIDENTKRIQELEKEVADLKMRLN